MKTHEDDDVPSTDNLAIRIDQYQIRKYSLQIFRYKLKDRLFTYVEYRDTCIYIFNLLLRWKFQRISNDDLLQIHEMIITCSAFRVPYILSPCSVTRDERIELADQKKLTTFVEDILIFTDLQMRRKT